jgi:hypothetical protein
MLNGKKLLILAALTLVVSGAFAAVLPDNGREEAAGGPDASVLLQFYPTPLAASPVGAVEDKAVWLAKVQGLIADAPPLLQQSTLASATQRQFAANLALLQQIQKGTLADGATAVKAIAGSGKVAIQADSGPNLGAVTNSDLVYTALAPCRIMDTRSATAGSGVQGPITGNVLKFIPGYITAGSNWGAYGGNATSDCALNTTAGANIYAIALVITILNPNFDAYLGVSDVNSLTTTLSTVALNYTHGQGLSTQYIVPLRSIPANIYFAMPTGLSAHLIFDVVGYFAVSQATALDCVIQTSSGTGTANFPGNSDFFLDAPNCPAGRTRTGTNCNSIYNAGAYWLAEVSTVWSDCGWHNTNASGTLDKSSFHAETVCCRVPGR